MDWVDEHRKLQGPHQRRRAGAGRRGDRLRRRGHRPVPHRAHVLRPHRRLPRDDPGRRRRRTARRRWPSCCRSSAKDFDGMFRAMQGRPVTIRLLDPPLHEFLPHDRARAGRAGEEDRRAGRGDRPPRPGAARVQPDARPSRLPPGHRLSRRSRAMQARAIFEAACDVKKDGIDGRARSHDPAGRLRHRVRRTRRRSSARRPRRSSPRRASKVEYLVGTMIELPRACVVRRPDRQGRRVLQLRHQRPDADRRWA